MRITNYENRKRIKFIMNIIFKRFLHECIYIWKQHNNYSGIFALQYKYSGFKKISLFIEQNFKKITKIFKNSSSDKRLNHELFMTFCKFNKIHYNLKNY